MAKIYVFKCPICGMSKRVKDTKDAFEPEGTEDFLRVQEIGGKVPGEREGRGKAKGRVETLESHPLEGIPEEYPEIEEKLKSRLEEVLESL